MFKGEKTPLFWAGLLLLSFASVVLFSTVWALRHFSILSQGLEAYASQLVSSIVFILVGFYMMKSGVKSEELPQQS